MKSVKYLSGKPIAPLATLLVLSPVIAELLFGTTHLTTIYLLIPQICIYGGAALLIRTLARRLQLGWSTILLLGVAFAVAEECVILQTSISPNFFGRDNDQIFGWAFGVNWVYLLWALGYESVWAIVLPIQLVELIFPERREEAWVGRRGIILTILVFLLASAVIWYRFTHVGIAPGEAYQASWTTIGVALLAIVTLSVAAFSFPKNRGANEATGRRVPRPGWVGLAAFGLSLPWFVLPVLIFTGPVSLPPIAPLVAGLIWAAVALGLIAYWSAAPAWQAPHRLALLSGALVASMLAGFLESGITQPFDLVGKLVINLMAVLLLAYLSRVVYQRVESGID